MEFKQQESNLKKYDFTDSQLLECRVLSPKQVCYLQHVYTELTEAQAEPDVASENTEERITNAIRRSFDGGKRAFIEELLRDSENAKLELQLAVINQ